ncbi:MAG: DUF2723 domain-containing protein [Planctomycetes bacterium]|nr:DUF2723 domain-containing protein [Planctomycetota bacterium]
MSAPSPKLLRGDLAVVVALFLAALFAFGTSAAPDVVTEGDCAEYVAAARVAGVPHAPGYPTYMLLASAVGRVVPAESLARALNLMSAFFGALTVGLVVVLTLRAVRLAFPDAGASTLRGSAGLAGVLLLSTTEFWNQSLSAEVYTLSTALLALCLERLSASPVRRRAAALVAGLAFGVHYNVGLPCALLVAASGVRARRELGARGLFALALAFGAGLATFLYLPLRSLADPALDFGDPETPERFWRMLTLADMPTGKAFGRDFGTLALQLAAVAGLAAKQWPAWVFALFGLGGVTLWPRGAPRRLGLALASILVLDYAGILAMANFALVEEELYELRFLFLPAYLALCVFGGLGFAFVAVRAERSVKVLVPLALLLIALTLAPWVYVQHERLDKSADRVMLDYGRALLDEPEGPALLFTYGDNAWMAALYLQTVWGLRERDVVLVAAGLLRHPWYRQQLVQRYPDLLIDEAAPGVAGIARANSWAHLYHADPKSKGLRGFAEVPSGLLTRLVPEGERVDFAFQPPPEFAPGYALLDMRERSIRADVLAAHARAASWCRTHGELREAERVLRFGLGVAPPVPRLAEFHLARAGLLLDLGDVQALQGKLTEARASWASARDEAPDTEAVELATKRLQRVEGGGGARD